MKPSKGNPSEQIPAIYKLPDLRPTGRKVYVVSLGCPKNLVDTERYLAVLHNQGFELTNREQDAEILLVNTCGFIEDAKAESVATILELADSKRENQVLVVAGCLVDRYPKELREEMPEVDLWCGLETLDKMANDVSSIVSAQAPEGFLPLPIRADDDPVPWSAFPRILLTPRHTAYLKISEGCDRTCSFCAIPSFRGKHRSVPPGRLIEEAQGLVSQGAKELTLIGQDTVAYGRDLGRDRSTNLRTLLEKLNTLDGLEWIRVLYTYPTRLADELEWAYANLERMIPYLDLPLQHLSDPVLERMRRGTPYSEILEHVTRLQEAVPNLVIRSTCIVGFPGETDSDHELLQSRFEELDIDHLGVFQYSDEEGTPAVDLHDKVPDEIASERFEAKSKWAASLCQVKAEKRLDRTVKVLVDGPCLPPDDIFPCIDTSGRWWQGRWWGQAPEIDGMVYFRGENADPGELVSVRLDDVIYPDYLGETP